MTSFLRTACVLLLTCVASAQHTSDERPDGGATRALAPASSVGPCDRTELAFDITSNTADVAILGVAHARAANKWFFSGRNGAPQNGGVTRQVLHVFDADRDGRPLAGTWRSVPQRGVTQSWGHRDLAYDPSANLVLAGDEARTIHAIDPVAESYLAARWTLPGLSFATIRGLAVHRVTGTYGANTLRVACCDWSTPIELWDLELVSPYRTAFTGTSLAHPGNAYGLAFSANGRSLVVFAQRPNPCSMTSGLHEVHVLDATTGNARWSRGGDGTVVGEATYPFGGLAGGCELSTVSNQTVLCCVQQALDDALTFLPLGGHAFLDDASGCPAGPRLLPLGDATVPGPGFGLELRGASSNDYSFVFVDANRATTTLTLPSGCRLDVSPAAPLAFFLVPDATGRAVLSLPIPPDPVLEGRDIVADSVEFTRTLLGLTTSSQALEVHFDPSRL
ncbi:MAG: hypothetical protein H6834_12305 [Planctomycetes bacterium]|nr:hypothetical protein [Planctomycetota bacterium]